MSQGPRFDLIFEPRYGEAVRLSPLVRRITVNNPSAFTFRGTNTYIIGERSLAVIDPGPIDAAHMDASRCRTRFACSMPPSSVGRTTESECSGPESGSNETRCEQ